MTDLLTPPACARCGGEFGRDTAVVILNDIAIHARPDECVLVFRARISELEAENADLRDRLATAAGYEALWKVTHGPEGGRPSCIYHTDGGWEAWNAAEDKLYTGIEDEATAWQLTGRTI